MITKLVIRSDYGARGFSRDGKWSDAMESLVHTWILRHDGTAESFQQAYSEAELRYVNDFIRRTGGTRDSSGNFFLEGVPTRFHAFQVLRSFDMEEE